MAAWFGLLTGCGELVWLGVQKFIRHDRIYFGSYIAWLTPVVCIGVFVLLGGLLALIVRCWARWQNWRNALTYLAFFACLSWLLLLPKLKDFAALLLAAGLAFQFGRLANLPQARLRGWLLRSAQLMVGLLLVTTIGVWSWQRIQQRQFAAQLPAPVANAPNVLLLVLDTVRARNLSVYGYARPTTPRLAEFAQTGVLFERAIATAPWTLPSHAGMFTGRYPHQLHAGYRIPLDGVSPTLAEVLRNGGYLTAGFVANTIYCNAENGLARGFAHYEDYQASASELLLGSSLTRALVNNSAVRRLTGYHDIVSRKSAADINRAFLAWLRRQDARPFFAFLNYFDAHEPCLPPAPFDTQFGVRVDHGQFRTRHELRNAVRGGRQNESAAQTQADVSCYDGAIRYLDEQVGALLAELKRRGVLKNTLVIITSDHGEAFGENGHYTHGDSAYLTTLHVPLLLSFPPSVPAGRRVVTPVTLRDLPTTVLALTAANNATKFPGLSLSRYWQTDSSSLADEPPLRSEVNIALTLVREYHVGMQMPVRSLVKDQLHYLQNYDGREELYNFITDPLEQHDLSSSEAVRMQLELFRRSLANGID